VLSLDQTISNAYRGWGNETPFAPDEVDTAVEQRDFESLWDALD
jgi:hypothetical protein